VKSMHFIPTLLLLGTAYASEIYPSSHAFRVHARPLICSLRGGYRRGASPSPPHFSYPYIAGEKHTSIRRARADETYSPVQPGELTDAERVYVLQQFERPEVRQRFITRVYFLVLTQVVFVTMLVCAMRKMPALVYRLSSNAPIIFMVTSAPMLWLSSRQRARKAPQNYVALFLFTALMGLALGAATAFLPADLLLRAGGTTVLAMVGLTVYALRTSRDFTMRGGLLLAGLFALFGLALVQVFLGGALVNSIKTYLGVVVFSAYIVYDTQLMVGGGKALQLRTDEHVLAAMGIFMDVVNLFMYILRAFMLERHEDS